MANLDALMTSARTGDSSKDEWMTPLWLFDILNKNFKFDLDPAATDENTLCDQWYTKEEDGLTRPWTGKSVFVNPPYSQMRAWVQKGHHEAYFGEPETVVMLVAARTDTRAWWDYIRFGDVRFLRGRLKFEHPNGARYSAPFPSAVVIFSKKNLRTEPKTIYWEVSEKDVC